MTAIQIRDPIEAALAIQDAIRRGWVRAKGFRNGEWVDVPPDDLRSFVLEIGSEGLTGKTASGQWEQIIVNAEDIMAIFPPDRNGPYDVGRQ